MAEYYSANGYGGKGGLVMFALKVIQGQQVPVVVGGGGAGGTFANIASWQSNMNGGAGGSSSFGTVVVAGGTGGTRAGPGVDSVFSYRGGDANHILFQIGNNGVGGTPSSTKWASGGAGQAGFVGVMW